MTSASWRGRIYAGREEPFGRGEILRDVAYPDYRDAYGRGLTWRVRGLVDPRINRLKHELREGAVLQAAHRPRLLRPNGRARVRLILVTGLPIPGPPPPTILRDELSDPRLHETLDTVIRATLDLVARQGYAMKQGIATVSGVDRTTAHRRWSILLEEAGLVEEQRVSLRGNAERVTTVATRPSSELYQG